VIRVACKDGGPKGTDGMFLRLDNECRPNPQFNPVNSSSTSGRGVLSDHLISARNEQSAR
jgi:hypothetical protein